MTRRRRLPARRTQQLFQVVPIDVTPVLLTDDVVTPRAARSPLMPDCVQHHASHPDRRLREGALLYGGAGIEDDPNER